MRVRLGADADELVGGPSGYRLRATGEALDIHRFERLDAEGRAHAEAPEHAAAAETLREALALWRGPALVDVADLPCAQGTVARLEEARRSMLEDRVEAELACGAHRELAAELEELTLTHPLRERLWTARMLALRRAGRSADALAAYRELYGVLAAELGLEPGEAARELHTAILRQDPNLDLVPGRPRLQAPLPRARGSAAIPLPPRCNLRPATAFIGRETEHRGLVKALEAVSAGAGRQVVLVAGEPGIGKTTLCSEFARTAHAVGAVVLYGRCDAELGVPYQPFAEALGHLVGQLPDTEIAAHVSGHAGDLAVLVPGLANRVAVLAPPRSQDAATQRFLLFGAVAALLDRAAAPATDGGGCLVLVLDDLHWADPPTLALLRFLAGAGAPARLLLVVTYRASEAGDELPVGAALAALRRDVGITDLDLAGLDAGAVASLVQTGTGCALGERTADLASVLHRETGGKPFYIKEMLRHLAERELLDATPATWGSAGLPDSVRATVRRRVARLGEQALRLLTLAAVLGREFDTDVLERAAGEGPAEVLSALGLACEAHLAVEIAAGRFGFVHAVVQHALTDALGPSRLAMTHRQVADALEQLHGTGPGPGAAELAQHRIAAGTRPDDPRPRLDYVRWAGEWAMTVLAPEEAVRWYTVALELFGSSPDTATRIDLLTPLGTAQLMAGDAVHRQTLLAASDLARATDEHARLVRVALTNHRGTISGAGIVDHERVDALRAALEVVELQTPEHARLLAHLAVELTFAGDWPARKALADEALRIARGFADPACLVTVAGIVSLAIWVPETVEERLALSAEVVALADAQPDPARRHWPHRMRIQACADAGDLAGVDHHGRPEQARELLAEDAADNFARFPYELGWLGGMCDYADVAAQVGDAQSGRLLYGILAPWHALIAGVHACFASGPVVLHLGSLAALLGEPERAEEHFRAALAVNPPARTPYWDTRAQVGLARTLLTRGDAPALAEARATARDAAATAEAHGFALVARDAVELR